MTLVREDIRVEPVRAQHSAALAQLLSSEHGCFCQYWFFQGDKNRWLEQCSSRADANEQRLREECEDSASPGLVALCDGQVVGWLRLSPLGRMTKLTQHGTYKRLALSGDNTLCVSCTYVREDMRNLGLFEALVSGIAQFAQDAGATRVLAFPSVPPGSEQARQHDAALMMGVRSGYEAAGFTLLCGDEAYPVMSLDVLQ